jgi:hypothetical protein
MIHRVPNGFMVPIIVFFLVWQSVVAVRQLLGKKLSIALALVVPLALGFVATSIGVWVMSLGLAALVVLLLGLILVFGGYRQD